VFDGIYEVGPSTATSTVLTVVVPIDVTVFEGAHTLEVWSYDATETRVHGPVTFTVEAEPGSGPPLLTLPEFVVGEATSPAGGTVTYDVSAVSAVTGDPVPVTCTPPSGSSFPMGFTTVSCSATDSEGTTSGSFTVFVTDFTPPVVTVPADIVSASPVVTFTATAVDNIDGPVSVSCVPASGSTFPFGDTTVVCTAIDSHANFGYGFFNVHVTGGPPLLTVPDDMIVEATSAAGAEVTFTVTAVDADTVACTPASGSTFPLGTTTVTCSATNAAGTTTDSFTITVEDHTGPVLTLPSLVEAEATSPAGASVTYVATAEDAVDGSVPIDCQPASGTLFPFGTTTVTCTASDTRGNETVGSFDVVVQDTTAPEITVATATPNTLWPPNHKMVSIALTVEATDAVDPSPSIEIVSVSSNQPVNGTGDGDTAPDWVITGPLSLQLRAERAGDNDRIYTITVSATDLYGNVSTATIEVRVPGSRQALSIH
ncbi:HYR domain-containing protein, partial [Candidatus Uhrbacteria bacterium]|nr:HYR domain-containing protein [Candidatus Uhrbacteria bacterium]